MGDTGPVDAQVEIAAESQGAGGVHRGERCVGRIERSAGGHGHRTIQRQGTAKRAAGCDGDRSVDDPLPATLAPLFTVTALPAAREPGLLMRSVPSFALVGPV